MYLNILKTKSLADTDSNHTEPADTCIKDIIAIQIILKANKKFIISSVFKSSNS